MATKLGKSEFPQGHSDIDFTCFGPPATKDGDFEKVRICDMGCFNQDGKDSCKYYHAAIVQSKKNQNYYVYFEWGRTGATNPQFQFIVCSSISEAEREFAKQLHDKNDKRGEWINHPSLGKILRAKSGKDCYLVRPLTTRTTGLPDARTIRSSDVIVESKKTVVKKNSINLDSKTHNLLKDLNVGTIQYTKGAMTSNALPTVSAITEARDILSEATKRIGIIGDNLDNQVNDNELKHLTSILYGRIPKKKARNSHASTWILSQNNILSWQQDLDAFEAALQATELGQEVETNDPYDGMPIKMNWIDPASISGKYLHQWIPRSSRNVHHVGNIKILNLWQVERKGEPDLLINLVENIKLPSVIKERPLHQTKRTDLDNVKLIEKYEKTNTALLWHGTRSVNVSGILRSGFRFPKELKNTGVSFAGAMFGEGTYFADDYKKSLGYTSHRGSYWSGGGGGISNRGAFMFLADVLLGNPHVAPRSFGYTKYPDGTHSIFGKAGVTSSLQNNEWIIFQKSQQRLRYLVEFTT